MRRRKQFYEKNKTQEYDKLSQEERGEISENRVYYTVKDQISLSLEYGFGENQMATCDLVGSSNDSSKTSQLAHSSTENSNGSFKSIEQEAAASRRYLLAPAGFSIKLLKKYVLCKWDLPNTKYKAQVFYLNEELEDDLKLMDVAYIHNWQRMAPLRLFYRFIPRQPKANKLAKLKSSQSNQISNLSSPPAITNSEPIVNKQLNNVLNRQENHQLQIGQPVTKKAKLDHPQQPLPINRLNVSNLTCNNPPQKQNPNRSSPLLPNIRNSPVQPVPTFSIKPIRKTDSPSNIPSNSMSNSNNLANNLKVANNRLNNIKQDMKQVSNSSLQQQICNSLNQQSQQVRTTAFTPTKPIVQNTLPLKRPISASKPNNNLHNGQNVLDQINRNEFESANKYRRINSNDKEFIPHKREFSSPPAISNQLANQISNQISLANYKQQQQRKQLNNQLKINQFNSNQNKLPNVNQLNTNLNINLNNLNLNTLNNTYLQNVLFNNTTTTIQSSSTVTSLRNVRVSGAEKKKPSNNNTNLSSHTISTKYNIPSPTNMPSVNKSKTPPKNSFNISSILENTNSSHHINNHHSFHNLSNHSTKAKDDKLTINLLNSSSLNNLNQMQSANLDNLNINNNLNNLNSPNLPISPTSGNHKRKSFDKSPINELGSSVTAKGIKIFSLSSPTGSSSSNSSLNNSLISLNNSNSSQKQNNQNLNKSNSSDKYSPVKPNATVQPIERKSPKSLPSQANLARKSVAVKPNVVSSNNNNNNNNNNNYSINSSIKSLNAINNAQHNSSSQNLIKIAPTLEAVGLLSCSNKLPNVTNTKKSSSLDEIVNKIKTSNGIGKSVAVSATSVTSSLNGFSNGLNTTKTTTTTPSNDANSLSFAQAVNNGLKTAAEQISTKQLESSNLNKNIESNKQVTDSLTIKLPLNNLNSNLDESKAKVSPNQQSNNSKETKSLFLNSKIEVIEEDESKMVTNLESNEENDKKSLSAEQVFSDDDSQDRKLVVVIPETENSCSSSAADDKMVNEKEINQQTILKQNQSLCAAIQANTPPSSSPDFSKKFSSSRSNSPISTNDEKSNTNDENANNQTIEKQMNADPVSPPLTPSPRLCEQGINRENNFGALDLSTRKIPAITLTAPKIAESV